MNPYDLEEASAALAAALGMPQAEQAERMRALRALVQQMNVYRWAGRMLSDAGRLQDCYARMLQAESAVESLYARWAELEEM